MLAQRNINTKIGANCDTGQTYSVDVTEIHRDRRPKESARTNAQLAAQVDGLDVPCYLVKQEDSIASLREGILTERSFDALLAALDADRDVAGRKYEEIRAKLMRYFECRGCLTSADEADETINVVARKIHEGLSIEGDDLCRYFFGVARNVLREYWASSQRVPVSLECLSPSDHPFEDPLELSDRCLEDRESEEQLEALDQCLHELPEETREMIVGYYQRQGAGHRMSRRMLAHRMGIPITALRIRAHRARLHLKGRLSYFLNQSARGLTRTQETRQKNSRSHR
jgi:RNA polymerase sigma factor (sigma-70 family)